MLILRTQAINYTPKYIIKRKQFALLKSHDFCHSPEFIHEILTSTESEKIISKHKINDKFDMYTMKFYQYTLLGHATIYTYLLQWNLSIKDSLGP